MRTFALSNVKSGMTRLRDKGGASKDSLYDLVNAYVTVSGSIKPRPGTRRNYTLPAGTKGLAAFQGKLHVFASSVIASTSPDVVINVLDYPDPDEGISPELARIHFAAPFLGYLYVSAEFDDGAVFHYWLEGAGDWQANKTYLLGEVVEPTVPNGLVYRARRLNPAAPTWDANAPRTVGDIREPNTFDGFQYEVVETIGDSPRSGATEPDWNAEDGAQTIEDVDVTPGGGSGGVGSDTPPNTPPPNIQDRYGNSPWRNLDRITEQN